MADGDLLSLLLKVEGGEASAAEIGQVKAALRGVEEQNIALKSNFQEGFQHIALRGFTMEAARAAGLGSELRPMLRLVQTGLTEVAVAAGVAGTAALTLTTGFVALGALAFVIHQHFAKHSEDLNKTVEGLQANAKAMDEYVAAGGKMSTAMKDVAELEAGVIKKSLEETLATNKATLALQQQTLARYKDMDAQAGQAGVAADMAPLLATNSKKMQEAEDSIKKTTLAIEENTKGYITHADALKGELEGQKKVSEEDVKIAKSKADLTEKIKMYEAEAAGATDNAYQKREAAINKFSIQQHAAIAKEYKNEVDKAHAIAALDLTVAAQRKANYTATMEVALHAEDTIAGGIGNAFAKTLVEGKDFEVQMKALFTQIAEQIIAELIRVEIQAAITHAALAGALGGGGASTFMGPIR